MLGESMEGDMAHDPEILKLLAGAIQDAHIHDPDAGFGTTWNSLNLSGEECTHYAKAVMNRLQMAGLEIVTRKTG